MTEEKIRLQKVLSEYLEISRRKAEHLIKENKVQINKKPAVLGTKINPKNDEIFVLNKKIEPVLKEKKYLILNKPRGYITTTNDELSRKSVCDLVENVNTRLYPVGRLDKNSEGLLIMTNDGNFANFMMHPSSHVEKIYKVVVKPKVSKDDIKKLKDPSNLFKKKMMPVKVFLIKNKKDKSILNFILREGKNKQIRRMCESLNLEVEVLKRIAIGNMKLGSLKVGQYKEISIENILLKVGIDIGKYRKLF